MKLIHTLHTSPDILLPYLTDMDLFVSVHPVISKMTATGKNQYKVFETLKFGPMPFSFTYPAVIHFDASKGVVHMHAIIFKMTTVEMLFNLSAENGLTTIEETIQIKSILPLKSLIVGILKTQHLALFKNIAKHISRPSS